MNTVHYQGCTYFVDESFLVENSCKVFREYSFKNDAYSLTNVSAIYFLNLAWGVHS